MLYKKVKNCNSNENILFHYFPSMCRYFAIIFAFSDIFILCIILILILYVFKEHVQSIENVIHGNAISEAKYDIRELKEQINEHNEVRFFSVLFNL